MAFEPDKITEEHVLKAVKRVKNEDVKLISSIRWDVLIDNEHYPPKDLLRYAHEEATGEHNWSLEGGEPTNKVLRNLGFTIIDKSGEDDPIIEMIGQYKNHVRKSRLSNEIYKWQLVKKYLGRPDITAIDFPKELRDVKLQNLVYPQVLSVIKRFLDKDPESYRKALENLFDESIPIETRVTDFYNNTEIAWKEIRTDENHMHYQDERTAATFLTYHDPEKYTFYMDSFYQKYCQLIGVEPEPRNQKYAHYLELLHDLIDNYLVLDEELLDLKNSILTDDCFHDENHLILAQDILFQMLYQNRGATHSYWRIGTTYGKDSYWERMKSNNYISVGWKEIKDLSTLGIESAEDIKTLIEQTGEVKNKGVLTNQARQLFNFYHNISEGDIILAQEGQKVLGIGKVSGEYGYDGDLEFPHYKPVDWIVKNPEGFINTEGLRTTVKKIGNPATIHQIDILLGTQTMSMELNQILYGPPGTGKTYALSTEYFPKFTSKRSAMTEDQYLNTFFSKRSWWETIALVLMEVGPLRVPDIMKHHYVKIKASLSNSRTVSQTLWGVLLGHTIDECEGVNVKIRSAPQIFFKNNSKEWRIVDEEVREHVPELLDLVEEVKDFDSGKDEQIKRYEFVTFHQSFTYEDFIEGIKPVFDGSGNELSYRIEDGVFKRIALTARQDPGEDYALFIDEINRGNVSQIFGELITLIEADKREGAENALSTTLPYSKDEFSVPGNLHIIGTMNTADRSVEALDTALRRRFSFIEMPSRPEVISTAGKAPEGKIEGIDLVDLLVIMNKRIEKLLDKDHMIGHSYFLSVSNLSDLKGVFQNKIIPLLQEYFFGDFGKIGLVLGDGYVQVAGTEPGDDLFAPFNDYDIGSLMEKNVYTIQDVLQMPDEQFIKAIELLKGKFRS